MKDIAREAVAFLKSGNPAEAENKIRAFLQSFKDSGTMVALGLGKTIAKSDLTLEALLPLVQHFWDSEDYISKTFAVAILSKKTKEGSALVPVLYRLILSCEKDEEAERLALSFAGRFFRDNKEMQIMLDEWEHEPAPYFKKVVEMVKERL